MQQKPRISKSKELLSRLEKLNRGKLGKMLKTGGDLAREQLSAVQAPVASEMMLKCSPASFVELPVGPIADEPDRAPEPIMYRRDLPRSGAGNERHCDTVLQSRFVVLEESLSGKVVLADGFGGAYLIECNPCEETEGLRDLGKGFASAIGKADSAIGAHLRASMPECDSPSPSDILFVDVESTGLGSCPLFLIGTMEWEQGNLVVRQYLARNYAEEAAVISLFAQRVAQHKLIVSFNGKSFDIPFIKTRAAANNAPFCAPPFHLDLLHHSRRLWRGVFPDCKLQTLELHVCHRKRYGDIPGSEIPEAYHAYVRTANAVQLVEILKHNMLDMVTLADLMVRMPSERAPVSESQQK